MVTEAVINFLSLLTLFSNAFLIVILLSFVLSKVDKRISRINSKLTEYLKNWVTEFSLVVSLTATLGSLYFSEVALFEPCKLCWFQRIFMYPLPIIFITALIKKTKEVFDFVLPLSIIGAITAGYHYYLQLNPNSLAPCSVIGFSVSCSERFFTNYGYITIPWMALSAFLIISFFGVIVKGKSN